MKAVRGRSSGLGMSAGEMTDGVRRDEEAPARDARALVKPEVWATQPFGPVDNAMIWVRCKECCTAEMDLTLLYDVVVIDSRRLGGRSRGWAEGFVWSGAAEHGVASVC